MSEILNGGRAGVWQGLCGRLPLAARTLIQECDFKCDWGKFSLSLPSPEVSPQTLGLSAFCPWSKIYENPSNASEQF